MKRFFLLFALLFFAFLANSSYSQKMSVASFEMVENDMDARINEPKVDQNGKKAALIKIETTEKGFAFDVGQLGVVDVNHSKVAYEWVYVPHGVIRISIMHQQLGVLEYEFPMPIKEATVYKMKLTTSKVTTFVEESAGGQYFVMKCTPSDAQITIDNGVPIAIVGGVSSHFLSYGKHEYRVEAPLYAPSAGVVEIGEQKMEHNVVLQPQFCALTVNSTPTGADVKINNLDVGKTPYYASQLPFGNYTVTLSAPNHAIVTKNVTLSKPSETVVVTETLSSYFSTIKINSATSGAQIFVNGEPKATGSWSGSLLPGNYEVKVSLAGHRDVIRLLTVEASKSATLDIPQLQPIYGSINVNSTPIDVAVAMDGKPLGTTPNIFSKLLTGSHKFTFTKAGYDTVTKSLTIDEGKVLQHNVVLYKTATPTASTSIASASTQVSVTENRYVPYQPKSNIPQKLFTKADYIAMGRPEVLTIPNNYTEIAVGAFVDEEDNDKARECPTSLTIPSSIVKIHNGAFDGYMFRLKDINVQGNNFIFENGMLFNGDKSELIICIEKLLSSNLVIPSSVKIIHGYSLFTCDNLTSVTIPNSVIEIGACAFYGCDGLTSVVVPNSVTTMGRLVFGSCSNLTSVTLPSSISRLENSMFYSCDKLASVNVPLSVTYIGYSIFPENTKIHVPANSSVLSELQEDYPGQVVVGANSSAYSAPVQTYSSPSSSGVPFTKADYIAMGRPEVLKIPNNYTEIAVGAFVNEKDNDKARECPTSLTIPSSIVKIHNGAFDGYKFRLKDINVQGNNFIFENGMLFNGDKSELIICIEKLLSSNLVIPSSVKIIHGYSLFTCDNLTSVTIPNSVIEIGACAFYGCDGLTSVVVPNSVTTMGSMVFGSCSNLTSVNIPENLIELESSMFTSCSQLKSISIPMSVKKIGYYVFDKKTKIYVSIHSAIYDKLKDDYGNQVKKLK